LLAEFNSAVEAVRCATEIQAALRTRNEHLSSEEKMQFRMGINLGDVIIQGGDLLGDGVNVAARIQTATAPGGICISGSVHDQIQNKLSLNFKLLGEQTYKNIAKPVRTYTIEEGAAITTPARRMGWRVPAAITAAVLAIAGAGTWGYYRQYDARLAAQMVAQKQATEQAQQAAEEGKREVQLQAQKLSAEEGQRRAQEERNRVEQDRKLFEAERRVTDAAKRQAAEEALRRAQEERTQLAQERKLIETEKQAAGAARKQADASQRPASTAAKDAPKLAVSNDGAYRGRLCNQFPADKVPDCWQVALTVRNGIVEGSWISKTKKMAKVRGTVAADSSVKLNLEGWTQSGTGTPVEALLLGRIADGVITASGRWGSGVGVAGDWKRTQVAAVEPVAQDAPQLAASHDGTYNGRICNQFPNKAPVCWQVALAVRNGIAEGSWIHPTQKSAWAKGAVAADGSVKLSLESWTPSGTPMEAILHGRIVDGAITASGQWRNGVGVAGDWKRTP
jgi:hypothetical protein